MPKVDKNEEREERIRMEIVVDAYDRHERAIGWYTYLGDTIRFPFEARCIKEREVSPLEEGENAHVVGMSSVEASESEMVVTIEWMDRELGVPLAQLTRWESCYIPIERDERYGAQETEWLQAQQSACS